MTDGILLAETQTDPLLAAYDTLIIDEAHERSLNIDFLLGYLKTLLPRRPDLKVVVTSATLDAERFARHFADAAGKPAPVIEVSGPVYPIEMRYRPVESEALTRRCARRREGRQGGGEGQSRDLMDALVDAVDEAQRCGPGRRAGLPARRARDPRGRRGVRKATTCPAPRSCRCSRASRRRSKRACSRPPTGAGWCCRPTSPRPR